MAVMVQSNHETDAAAPQSEAEDTYVVMISTFTQAIEAGLRRRARALGRELDRAAAVIGKDRADSLQRWLFSDSSSPVPHRSH